MDKKLVVLFVTNNYTPYRGGLVSSIQQSAQGLRQAGHTVKIITLDFGDCEPEKDVIRLYCPIKFRYKTNYMAIPWRATAQLHHIITQYKPDIIHVHHPFLLGSAAARIAQCHNIPLFFTYHTRYENYVHYCPLPQIISKLLVQYLVKKFCKYPDCIIAPSNSLQKDLLKTIQKPIIVIPSSVASYYFQKKQKKYPRKKFHIVTVSRFVQEKNIPFLIDALVELDPTQFVCTFAGYGPEYHYLQNYAFTIKNIPHTLLHFLHKPSKKELIQLYADADVFIFASTTETQGIVLAEAMASETPVIAYNAPGQQDIIHDGYNGFLVSDALTMHQKIVLLAQDHEQLVTLRKHAAKTAQQYKPAYISQQLIAAYQTIIEQKKGADSICSLENISFV